MELEVRLFLDGRSSSTTLRAQGGESAEAAVQRFMREQGLHTRKDAGDLSVKLLNAVRSRMAERREPEPALQQRAGEVQVASTAAAAAEVASAASIPALASEVAESDATVWMPISAPLVVRRGQTLASAARAFCEEHGLDPSATAPALLASLRDTQRHLAGAPARAVLGATPLVQAAAPRFPGSAGRHWPPLPVIASRGEFGTLLEQLGFRTGIEIGVQRGWFAAHLLQTWPSCTAYYGIDPWERQVLYTDAANVEQEEHDSNYAATLATLARFGSKVHLLRNYSVVRALLPLSLPEHASSPPPRARRMLSRTSQMSRSTLCMWMPGMTTSACTRISLCTGPSCARAASWPATTS